MLLRAPAVLCAGSAFQRAILSLVKGGRMVAETAYFSGQERAAATTLAQLQANPLRLEHTLIETELLRRRRATIVLDAHVHPRVDRDTAQLMGWRSYAAAPLVVGSQVAGVIHADRGRGQQLDVLDRDVLWEFATGLAQAYESTTLRRTLRDERDQMRQFLDWLGARSSELTDAPVTLSAGGHAPLPPPPPLPDSVPGRGRDDRVVFEGLLTPARARRPAAARRRRHQPRGRRRARDLERDGQVPREQHPAQAARGQPGRGGDALPAADGDAGAVAGGAAPRRPPRWCRRLRWRVGRNFSMEPVSSQSPAVTPA